MKKLLGIVVLGLLLGGNAFAEMITLTKCHTIESYGSKSVGGVKKNPNDWLSPTFKNWDEQIRHPEFKQYENILYSLDTAAEIITATWVHTDAYLKYSAEVEDYIDDKFVKSKFIITDLGGNIVTATRDSSIKGMKSITEINIDFKTNKIYKNSYTGIVGTDMKTLKDVMTNIKIRNVIQCKRF